MALLFFPHYDTQSLFHVVQLNRPKKKKNSLDFSMKLDFGKLKTVDFVFTNNNQCNVIVPTQRSSMAENNESL